MKIDANAIWMYFASNTVRSITAVGKGGLLLVGSLGKLDMYNNDIRYIHASTGGRIVHQDGS